MDYCCYGALLASVLLGMPSRVTAVASRLTKREICVADNAMLTMEYPEAVAVAEGSWSQIGKLGSYTTMIYGTDGAMQVEPRRSDPPRGLVIADREHPDGREVTVPESTPDRTTATAHFVARVRDDEPLLTLCDPRHARNAQEMLEAGSRSVGRRGAVSLPLN